MQSNGFTGTFELAQWCKLLRDRGWTGQQVARSLGRSEGYVNNLIRILERASLAVLERWKVEQQPASGLAPICATDWLMHVCVLPHDVQDLELAKRLERTRPKTDPPGREHLPPELEREPPEVEREPG
jgi:hypothetical protein